MPKTCSECRPKLLRMFKSTAFDEPLPRYLNAVSSANTLILICELIAVSLNTIFIYSLSNRLSKYAENEAIENLKTL